MIGNSEKFPIKKGTNVPIMCTRTKMWLVASDRAKREKCAEAHFFYDYSLCKKKSLRAGLHGGAAKEDSGTEHQDM